MKKIVSILALVLSIFLIEIGLPKEVFAAPRIYFEPNSISTTSGSNFNVNIKIDTDSKDVFGSEVVINYPSSNLEVKSINSGGFFPDFNSAFDTSKIVIRTYSSSPYDNKNGVGTLATISFSAKSGFQTTSASFACGGSTDTQIIDTNGVNILSCSSINQLTVTISSNNPPTDPPINPPQPGTPNSCGGTCGSDINCQSGLFCYTGYCRNPSCPSSTNCSCSAATTYPTATAKPKIISKITPSPTSQAIVLENYEDNLIIDDQQPIIEDTQPEKTNFGKFIPYILLLILIILIILFFKRKKKEDNNVPPTVNNPNPVEPVIGPVNDFSTQNQNPPNPIPPENQQPVQPPIQQNENINNIPLPPVDNQNSNI